jgi:hypothetical protein
MSKTCIVACKIPSGLTIDLRHPDDPLKIVQKVSLEGYAIDMKPFVKEDGVGLTVVDEDFWNAWEKWAMENNYAPYVAGLIFAAASDRNVKAEAKEKAKELSGLERLDMPSDPRQTSNDPRLAEFRSASLTAIQK